MWDRLLPWSYVAQREESQGHSLFCATFCWNNWEKNSTPRVHLAPFSTVLFISPNCLFLKSTVTPGKRKLSFQTVAPVLILQQANHDFTNTSLFCLTSKIPGWPHLCPSWISMWYLFGKKASQAKELLLLYWMMAWSGITRTSMPIMWVWALPWLAT